MVYARAEPEGDDEEERGGNPQRERGPHFFGERLRVYRKQEDGNDGAQTNKDGYDGEAEEGKAAVIFHPPIVMGRKVSRKIPPSLSNPAQT